ncbi:putative receptor-like protein kinase [Nymphaea thermarum]|nr:putative receptor-like protein kinase [Nymphaea thermarum]
MISVGGWVSSARIIQGAPFFFFVFYFFFNPVLSATNPNYTACAPPTCDGISINYPFSLSSQSGSGCGYPGLNLLCLDNNRTLLLQTPTLNFTVSGIDYSARTIDVAIDPRYMEGPGNCQYPRKNMTLQDIKGTANPLPFIFANGATTQVTFFYNCTTPPSSGSGGYGGDAYDFTGKVVPSCSAAALRSYAFFGADSPGTVAMSCQSSVTFPVSASSIANNLMSALSDGFSMNWTVDATNRCYGCSQSGGRCGSDSTGNFICFCQADSQPDTCNHSGGAKNGVIIAGIGAAVACALLIIGIACVLYSCTRCTFFRRYESLTTAKLERFLSDYRLLTVTRYTYNEIKRMTNKFEHKLGQGGYGSVFKGKLPNGHLVAVKLMEKSYNDGEEFINEVATIGRIHHVNVVRLVGFCVEGSRRALIYEFMANGSLEKHIQMNETTGCCHLAWEKLQSIAVAIARGIEYLHQGCDQRIIHFDIKPHNILLDEDFTPKISDFGLAKLHCKEQSLVSITQGKGTIGYIAPEVFYGNFKHVSHKSDVYSFGMLLLALAGMKGTPNSSGSNTSEAYFPQCIYDRLCHDKGREVVGIGEETMRKITIIALWCIQWNPVDRPSIKEIFANNDQESIYSYYSLMLGNCVSVGPKGNSLSVMPPKMSFGSLQWRILFARHAVSPFPAVSKLQISPSEYSLSPFAIDFFLATSLHRPYALFPDASPTWRFISLIAFALHLGPSLRRPIRS